MQNDNFEDFNKKDRNVPGLFYCELVWMIDQTFKSIFSIMTCEIDLQHVYFFCQAPNIAPITVNTTKA